MSSGKIPVLIQELRTKVADIDLDLSSRSSLFVDLPAEWIEIVEALLILPSSDNEIIIIDKFHVPLKHRDLLRLKPEAWLNDEVINFYMKLCEEREKALGRHDNLFMSTFFYAKLMDYGKGFNYANVKRWYRGIDIFSRRRIFIPINMAQHWSLVCIHLPNNEIQYVDSIKSNKKKDAIMKNIARWLKSELIFRNGDDSRVFTETTVTCPQQENCYDCGVFVLSFAELLSNDLPLDMMSQSHCDRMRKAIAFWIVRGRLVSTTLRFLSKNYLFI